MIKAPLRNLALYVDLRRKAAIEAARAVADIAKRNHVMLQVGPAQAEALNLNGASSQRFPQSADVVVSLGGDGTLLRAAHLAGPLGIPLIGVDFGRVGFLTEVGRTGYELALETLLTSGMPTQSHLALEARLVGSAAVHYAVNDVHLDRKHLGHIVNFGILLSGQRIATIPADGVVIASPIGSTAYFLSAGGPIMSPKLEAIGITPICPHTLFSRPLIVSAGETIRIELPDDVEGTQFFVDGEAAGELAPGAAIEVVRAAQPVRFARLGTGYFFQTLERKLHWGMSIKRTLEGQ